MQLEHPNLVKMNQNIFNNRNASQVNSTTVEQSLLTQMYPQSQQYPPLPHPLSSSFTTKSSKKVLSQKMKQKKSIKANQANNYVAYVTNQSQARAKK